MFTGAKSTWIRSPETGSRCASTTRAVEVYVIEGVVPEVMEGVVHDLRRDGEGGAATGLVTLAVEDCGGHPRGPQTTGGVLAPRLAFLRL
jgi:hypothetical protein